VRLTRFIRNFSPEKADPALRRELENQHKYNFRGSLKIQATDKLEILAQGWYGRFTTNGPDNRTKYIVTGALPSATDPNQGLKPSTPLNAVLAYEASVGNPIGGLTTPLQIATSPRATVLALVPQVNALIADLYNRPRDQASVNGTLLTSSYARSAGGALTFSYDLGDATLRSISGYDYGMRTSLFNVGGGPFAFLYANQNATFRQFTQELQLTGKALDSKLTYALGAYYYNLKSHHGREGLEPVWRLPVLRRAVRAQADQQFDDLFGCKERIRSLLWPSFV